MTASPTSQQTDASPPLVPRFELQGYSEQAIAARRQWIAERSGTSLEHVAGLTTPGEALRGNVENPIGAAQVPLGLAGPLRVHGEHANGVFYVPLATTEGALVRSYERGMTVMTRAGGVTTRLLIDANQVAPVLVFDDLERAVAFARAVPTHLPLIRAAAEATTRHGRLLAVDSQVVGREVMLLMRFSTGDAGGMNMIAKASDAACRALLAASGARRYYLFSGAESEKRPSASLLAGGKGRKVIAAARLPARLVNAYLHTTPSELAALWRHTVVGNLQAGALGYGGQLANGLAALFIACGQDVANVVNSAVGITMFEVTDDGDLYACVTLPALTVATVGGGTGTGTARECLELLGCAGTGGAAKLAEITAATLLAGELSMGAALASGEHVQAHEDYGRNHPRGVAPEGADGTSPGAPAGATP